MNFNDRGRFAPLSNNCATKPVWDKKIFAERMKECINLKYDIVKNNLDYIKENLSKYFLPKFLPQGAMHTDVKPENTIFFGKKFNGVVDFDNSYIGPLVLDLALTMMWYCSDRGKFNLKTARILYQSYNKIRPLSKIEKKYLFKALHYAFFSTMCVVFYHLSVSLRSYEKKIKEWYIRDISKLVKYMKWIDLNLFAAEKNFKITEQEFFKIFN